jgi:hypothetical protein
VALACYGEEVNLVRARTSEPARYYCSEQTIVVRKGLLIHEERRHLWHELVHVRRGDEHWHTDERTERHVERVAVRLAIPTCSLQWAAYQTETVHDLADLLKLPQEWVEFRWRTAPQWERDLIRRHDPVYGVHTSTLNYP